MQEETETDCQADEIILEEIYLDKRTTRERRGWGAESKESDESISRQICSSNCDLSSLCWNEDRKLEEDRRWNRPLLMIIFLLESVFLVALVLDCWRSLCCNDHQLLLGTNSKISAAFFNDGDGMGLGGCAFGNWLGLHWFCLRFFLYLYSVWFVRLFWRWFSAGNFTIRAVHVIIRV